MFGAPSHVAACYSATPVAASSLMPQHLCLDFGTGYCKAAACSPGQRPRPLAIGRAVRKRRGDRHMVRTALHVTQNGRLHFGEAALDAAGREDERPFDQIKEAMTDATEDGDLDGPLPIGAGPGGKALTKRQAITLYLAFLTRAALRSQNAPRREVLRSIAMPVFEAPKAQWVEAALRRSLEDAHTVAEHLGDALFEGVDLAKAVRMLTMKPRRPPQIVAKPATVAEPVAAAAARVLHVTPGDDERRFGIATRHVPGLMLVIDMGAGTTDIAMFAKGQVGDVVALRHVARSKRSIPTAGKAVDQALIAHLVGRSPTGQRERLEVDLQREGGGEPIKDQLFRQGSVDRPGTATTLPEFLDSAELRKVETAITQGFTRMLEAVDPSFIKFRTVVVSLSGGGASLPFLHKLAANRSVGRFGERMIQVKMALADPEPGWFQAYGFGGLRDEVGNKFHRLAVALGGAYYGAEAHSWLRLGEDIPKL